MFHYPRLGGLERVKHSSLSAKFVTKKTDEVSTATWTVLTILQLSHKQLMGFMSYSVTLHKVGKALAYLTNSYVAKKKIMRIRLQGLYSQHFLFFIIFK